MKLAPFAALLLIPACAEAPSSDAPETSAIAGPTPDSPPDSSLESAGGRPNPQLVPLWSETDFGVATFLAALHLDFGPDGSLAVASAVDDRTDVDDAPGARIDRFAPDGTRLWTAQIAYEDFAAELPPPESDTAKVYLRNFFPEALDHRADGTILFAFTITLDYADRELTPFPISSSRTYIRSYSPDGLELGTILVGAVMGFPLRDSVGAVAGLRDIKALPDGSIAWAGITSRGTHPRWGDVLVIEGAIGRLSADGAPLWTIPLGQELDFPGSLTPADAEETATDVQPMPDGGLVVRGQFTGVLTVGELRAETGGIGTFFARVELDGTPTWLETIVDSAPVDVRFGFPGLGLGRGGHLFSMSLFSNEDDYHLIEQTPDGEVINQVELEHDWAESLAVVGDRVVIGGSTFFALGLGPDEGDAWPALIQVRNPSNGKIVASRNLGAKPLQPLLLSRAFTLAVSDDGSAIAAGGTYQVGIDTGFGPAPPLPPEILTGAYVAVYRAP